MSKSLLMKPQGSKLCYEDYLRGPNRVVRWLRDKTASENLLSTKLCSKRLQCVEIASDATSGLKIESKTVTNSFATPLISVLSIHIHIPVTTTIHSKYNNFNFIKGFSNKYLYMPIKKKKLNKEA